MNSQAQRKSPSIDAVNFIVESDSESYTNTTTESSAASTTTNTEDEDQAHNKSGWNQANDTSSSVQQGNINNNQEHQSHIKHHRHHHKSNTHSINTDPSSTLPSNSNFNAIEYLINSLHSSLDSIELDRSLVLQSQISGELNNTSKEIVSLMDELQVRIDEHLIKYEELKFKILPSLLSNLNKSQKLSVKISKAMKEMYPVEYSKSTDKVINRVSDEDEDLYI